MRKFYAFIAAALMSVSMFATPATIPTTTDLAAGYDPSTNVVLCCYFDVAPCNDVVLAGSYNDWSDDPANCIAFEALDGFDGWFVAEVAYADGIQAKPLQLKNGGFSGWDYQAGDPDAWIHLGGEEATIENGYEGEANVSYSKAGAYIYEIAYWKNHGSPCVFVPTHKYTIQLYSPTICGDFKPALAGNFNSWGKTEMNEGLDDDFETVYTLVIEDEEGHTFKFRPTDDDDSWTKQLKFYDTAEDLWKDGGNNVLPVATKDTTLVFDYSNDELYRWAACDGEEAVQVMVMLKAPGGAPAAGIDIIGSFGEGWEVGTPMLYDAALNVYAQAIAAKSSDEFKFREAGNWGNQIQTFVGDEWVDMPNIQFGSVWYDGSDVDASLAAYKVVAPDFSNPALYKWTANEAGIENVVLTEQAQKVIVDGVLYIVRDGKMFNVQGTQVR